MSGVARAIFWHRNKLFRRRKAFLTSTTFSFYFLIRLGVALSNSTSEICFNIKHCFGRQTCHSTSKTLFDIFFVLAWVMRFLLLQLFCQCYCWQKILTVRLRYAFCAPGFGLIPRVEAAALLGLGLYLCNDLVRGTSVGSEWAKLGANFQSKMATNLHLRHNDRISLPIFFQFPS